MSVRATAGVIALLSVLAIVAAGCCAPAGVSEPGSITTTAAPLTKPGGAPTKPRIETVGTDAVAYGWVQRVGLEGGFWAVTSTSLFSSASPVVVAVLVPGAISQGEIEQLSGKFVAARGTLRKGASVHMAGPEIVVDAVQVYEQP